MAVHHKGEPLVPRKTEKLTIRIDPVVKEALRQAAEHDNRSVANMIEVLIRDHCRKAGVEIEGVLSMAEQSAARKVRR
ncbi:MAG: hypothetical protein HY896_14130 [Deltaproteobacteria bacterium]|nr:hypothetical protein [Deltaproteobacteria bacterium]